MTSNDPARHQFDFWLGEWDVFRPDGSLAGTNRIEAVQSGRVLHERYVSPSGYSGESLNIYDASRRCWHQTWVDNEGLLLVLEGHFRDGRMMLEGTTQGSGGVAVRHRISWTPLEDGSVRQVWESTDSDGRWTVAFDGHYRRRSSR